MVNVYCAPNYSIHQLANKLWSGPYLFFSVLLGSQLSLVQSKQQMVPGWCEHKLNKTSVRSLLCSYSSYGIHLRKNSWNHQARDLLFHVIPLQLSLTWHVGLDPHVPPTKAHQLHELACLYTSIFTLTAKIRVPQLWCSSEAAHDQGEAVRWHRGHPTATILCKISGALHHTEP